MKATPLYRIAGGTWLAGPRVKELEGSAMNKRVFLTFSLLVVCAVAALAADEKKASTAKTAETNMPEHKVFLASDIQWKDAPPILPSGAKVAVLDGDPAKAGYFAMRIKMPDGYKIMPHWHPNVERFTVISGTANVGMGDKFDDSKGDKMPAGSYTFMKPKVHHYFWARGETEIQISTIGPWKLVYLNPADDPSKKK